MNHKKGIKKVKYRGIALFCGKCGRSSQIYSIDELREEMENIYQSGTIHPC